MGVGGADLVAGGLWEWKKFCTNHKLKRKLFRIILSINPLGKRGIFTAKSFLLNYHMTTRFKTWVPLTNKTVNPKFRIDIGSVNLEDSSKDSGWAKLCLSRIFSKDQEEQKVRGLRIASCKTSSSFGWNILILHFEKNSKYLFLNDWA